jgi:hypothetical protein
MGGKIKEKQKLKTLNVVMCRHADIYSFNRFFDNKQNPIVTRTLSSKKEEDNCCILFELNIENLPAVSVRSP